VRAARTRSIVRSGPRIARVTTTHNPAIAWVRDCVIRVMPVRLIVSAFLIQRAEDPHAALRRAG
jgi:hypothetical protein